MGVIATLPREVFTKIAAGEVIEGPSSVVRELVDNALDAEAGDVRVAVTNGGKDSIAVSDDGWGMSEEDAWLSVQKHTTSKIRSISDLAAVSSLGFRGEALCSICAVSDFTMVTGREGSLQGTRVTCSGGQGVRIEPCAANRGTAVTVRNLFFNLPARKKFLRTNRAEAARVKEEVLKKALGFHERGFSYRSDDRLVLNLLPAADRRERVGGIFGTSLADGLAELCVEEKAFSVKGFISHSRHTLPNRSGQYFFINRRPVSDRSLSHALNTPCRGSIPAGRYLYACIHIQMDPSLVDVNVHPAKKEVKVRLTERLYAALRRGVEDALRGMRFPGFAVFPEDFIPEGLGDTAAHAPGESYGQVRSGVPGRHSGLVESSGKLWSSGLEETRGSAGRREVEKEIGSAEGVSFVGSVLGTYLLFEAPDSLIVIDQHAAHERVLYERFARQSSGGVAVKRLLVPLNFTPPRNRYGPILESLDLFREAGIELEPFGDESFNLVALPAFIPERREEETVSLFFEEYYEGSISPGSIRERFLKLAACRSACKEGDRISREQALSLFRDLMQTETPSLCPHGRPTLVRFSREYWEKLFGRR